MIKSVLIKPKALKVAGLVMGSLLLLFAANCSVEEQRQDGSSARESLNELSGQQSPDDRPEGPVGDNPLADSSACYVCHMNYDGEALALGHELVGVGCRECHGRSFEHCGDESNVTAPDIMYPKATINASCLACHPQDEIIENLVHRPLFSGTAVEEEKYCTGCHGREHRLAVRTVRWDKATGKLLKPGQ